MKNDPVKMLDFLERAIQAVLTEQAITLLDLIGADGQPLCTLAVLPPDVGAWLAVQTELITLARGGKVNDCRRAAPYPPDLETPHRGRQPN